MESAKFNIDSLLYQLRHFEERRQNITSIVDEDTIVSICREVRKIFLDQPALLEIDAPVKICGDIHGQFSDLIKIFEKGNPPSETNKYLFLGDYVDRGKFSIECILTLFAYKIKYPESLFLLRGNHEAASINQVYGFYEECRRKYPKNGVKLWRTFADCFNCLPLAALVEDKILCMHGGLSPELQDLNQINKILRPIDVPDAGLICDLLWSDPARIEGWGDNERGVSFTFGPDVVKQFLSRHDLDLICRAHQVVEEGYEFFADQKLVTVFSAPNYCGEYDNSAAMMTVDNDLLCSFVYFKHNMYGGHVQNGRNPTPPRRKVTAEDTNDKYVKKSNYGTTRSYSENHW